MYKGEIENIINASLNNALTFFVGAGVSALSGVPSWNCLIKEMGKELGVPSDKIGEADYLRVPQMYYYAINEDDDKYYEFIQKTLNTELKKPNAIHEKIFKLNPVSIVTTNYDQLLEEAAVQLCQNFKLVADDKEIPTIHGEKFILKIHGDFAHKNIVLKEEDYLNYSNKFVLTETLLKAIFSTNTVIFIGYSFSDNNIKMILNWTKSVLKDQFRKPIFVYTGENVLSNEELIYQESRGLKVIEWNKINPMCESYLDKYNEFFKLVRENMHPSVSRMNEKEAFDFLYKLVSPLNELNTLRIDDLNFKLAEYLKIEKTGEMYLKNNNILDYFIYLYQIEKKSDSKISEQDYNKYQTIKRVFEKARISSIEDQQGEMSYILSDKIITIGDEACLSFDFGKMRDYCNKNYSTIKSRYKKAYYYSRLYRYDESYKLFLEVSKDAFRENNYLIYYLAQVNCNNIVKILQNTMNTIQNSKEIKKIEIAFLSESAQLNLFNLQPIEFQNRYETLRNLYTEEALYKNSYDLLDIGEKLKSTIGEDIIEFGKTKSDLAAAHINQNLHFFLGNGLIEDVFIQYKKPVKYVMKLFLEKYAIQNQKIFHKNIISRFYDMGFKNEITFDEVDFYCFIEYFSKREIEELFTNLNQIQIVFDNQEKIDKTIQNIINYYKYTNNSENTIFQSYFQRLLATLITLLKYTQLSQETIDKFCMFMLQNEFKEITINDKLLFLKKQIYVNKHYSKKVGDCIEIKLIEYIEADIANLEVGRNIKEKNSYKHLIEYAKPDIPFVSRRLSKIIQWIFKKQLKPLYPDIFELYYYFTSKENKKLIKKILKDELDSVFDFDLFRHYIEINGSVNKTEIEKLKKYLGSNFENNTNCNIEKKVSKELSDVGFWIRRGIIPKEQFVKFKGKCSLFDFYFDFEEFDFGRFEASWLLDMTDIALEEISKTNAVRVEIRQILSNLLKDNPVPKDDTEFKDILVKYFC